MSKLPGHLSRMLGDPSRHDGSGNQADIRTQIARGAVLTKQANPAAGRVTRVSDHKVWVDVGLKSDGMIDISEFRNDGEIAVGDEVSVWIKSSEGAGGNVVLSREAVVRHQVWDKILEAQQKSEPVTGKVLRKDRAGNRYIVDVMGINAFLPFESSRDGFSATRLDSSHLADLNIGDEESFVISRVDTTTDIPSARVFLARRSGVLESEQIREKVEGQVFTGIVSGVSDAGAYVAIEVDSRTFVGWLPRASMHSAAARVKDALPKGSSVEVRVLRISDFGEVQLTVAHKIWEGVPERIKAGEVLQGKVVGAVDDGVLVALPGADGALVDIDSPDAKSNVLCGLIGHNDTCGVRGKSAEIFFARGKDIEVIVKDVDVLGMSVRLTIAGTATDPWKHLNLSAGEVKKCRVCNVVDVNKSYAKVFFEITEHVMGMWKLNAFQLWQVPKMGDELEMTVVECDSSKGKVMLVNGKQDIAKQDELIAGLSQGSQVKVKITHIIADGPYTYGLYVTYQDHLHGFISARQIAQSKSLTDYKVGDTVSAIVESMGCNAKEVNPGDRFIVLSILAVEKRAWRESHPARQGTFGSAISENN